MTIYGGCLGKDTGQHRRCKVYSETGQNCECTCEGHGEDYIRPDLNTPLHQMLMTIAVAHGIMTEEDMMSVMEGDDKQVGSVVEPAEETIEQLEEKRKK